MLRLEAAARAAKEAEAATSARFVPITLPATKAFSGGDLIAIVCVRPAIGSRKMPLPDVDALFDLPLGRSRDCLEFKSPAAPAMKREAEEEWA